MSANNPTLRKEELGVSVATIERAAIKAIEAQDFEAADALLDILRALEEEERFHGKHTLWE